MEGRVWSLVKAIGPDSRSETEVSPGVADADWVGAFGGEGWRDCRKERSSASASSSRVGALVVG